MRRHLQSAAVVGVLIGSAAHAQGVAFLNATDVGGVISRVVQEATARRTPATIAVVDRMGTVLAVYAMPATANTPVAPPWLPVAPNPAGPTSAPLPNGLNGLWLPTGLEAIAKADTAAYLSSSHGNAFTTRTASQIVQDHFNPGTAFAPSGPLYGVQFSSLPCSDLSVRVAGNDFTSLTRGPHRSPLGLAADPGGLPLYKGGELVGAVGVKAVGPYGLDLNIHTDDHSVDETLALAGTIGLDAPPNIRANTITAGGLTLRYTDALPGDLLRNPAAAPPFASLPPGLVSVPAYYFNAFGLIEGSTYGSARSGLVPDPFGTISTIQPAYLLTNSAGGARYPIVAGSGPGALSAWETAVILHSAYAVALQTRAQIRNPPGSAAAVTISVVDANANVLGVATVPDAPVFGIDVSLQKARSAAFLSNPAAEGVLRAQSPAAVPFMNASDSFFGSPIFSRGYAWSTRAISNIARDTYPDGVNSSANGPLSLSAALTNPFADGLQLSLIGWNLLQHVEYVTDMFPPGAIVADTPGFCTELWSPPFLANGLQVFPGGFPIYRGGQLIGGIGVSGDGVDQDDMVAFLGLYNAGQALHNGVGNAPTFMRASVLAPGGIAPHYVNCPYAPFLNSSAENVCTGK